jgi:formate-dependent phosphoribosylglycinamide formyltransferase (GAR transformylase)
MSSKKFVTGQSEIAERIANALGFDGLFVQSVKITIAADEIISVNAVFYPTEEQCEALGGEIEKFKQFGVVRGAVEFTYTEQDL